MSKGILIERNVGDKFGMLTILNIPEGSPTYFKCLCECGKEKFINKKHLGSKYGVKSCGCIKGNNTKTHGMTNTRIYSIWHSMKQRCNGQHHRYGGRGIIYDSRWEKFELFYEDMKEGYKENLTLDRKKVDGNYCKDNCRWITQQEQMYNFSKNIYYTVKGEKLCLSQLGKKYNIKSSTLYSRLKRDGYTIEQALGINKKNNPLGLIYKQKPVLQWIKELGLNKGTVYSRIQKLGRSIEDALYKEVQSNEITYRGNNISYYAKKIGLTKEAIYARINKGMSIKEAVSKGNSKPIYKGKTIPQWAKELGLSSSTIYRRIKNGLTLENAIK